MIIELGLYTFADVGTDPVTGRHVGPRERLKQLVEEIALADEVGLDVFGLGEHHRPDYAVSAPAIVLAAAASRTKKIKLTSAVTVLSSGENPNSSWNAGHGLSSWFSPMQQVYFAGEPWVA
jgi:hypothetical protein